MSVLKNLSNTVRGLLSRKDTQLPGFLGNLSGTVKADDANNVYVTLFGGEVRVVYNGKVPNVPRLPVIIGYAPGSNQLEILGARDVFTKPPYPEVPPHALLHTFPGADTIPIRGEQFLPGLITPASGLTVKVYGMAYQIGGVWYVLATQEIDLTAEVPASGALMALLQVDTSGAISITAGTAVDARSELGFDDIPAGDADQYTLGAVKLYNGQDRILFTVTDTDIVDLRWGRGSGGSTASAISVTDAGGYFAGADVEAVLQELGLDGRSFATTVTAMGTTTLNATSPTVQMFTGTSLHTVDLPDTSTIFTSKKFHIINRSTQVVSVRSSTGVSLLLLGPGTDNVFTCTSTADNLATSWKWSTTSEDALLFTDIGTANSSTTKHGLLRKLSGVATEFMNGVGNWVNATTAVLTGFTAGSGTVSATDTILEAIQKIVGNIALLLGVDGWFSVSETWTRTGNHTFTVSGDLTTKYKKGRFVRYRDGGSDEYGVIHSSSHSSGTTTVNLVPNTDYAMASATITNTYIALTDKAEGMPKEFNFTPSPTNLTLGNATVLARWRNDLSFFRVHIILGSTSSVSGSITMATPFDTPTIIGFPRIPVGVATFLDASPLGTTLGNVVISAANTILLQVVAAGGTYATIGGLSATIPFTWATSDEISFFANIP